MTTDAKWTRNKTEINLPKIIYIIAWLVPLSSSTGEDYINRQSIWRGYGYGISTIFQLYRGGWFYWWRKPEYPEKTIDLPEVYHIKLYRLHLTRMGFKLIMLVVIGTNCIGSYKSNYHTITTPPGLCIWMDGLKMDASDSKSLLIFW